MLNAIFGISVHASDVSMLLHKHYKGKRTKSWLEASLV